MSELFSVAGKVAIVTGASSGLGARFAKVLAQNGAKVAIMARRVERLEEVKAEIEAAGGECFSHKLDVTDEAQIIEAVNATKAHFGRIDILVNNAGVANAFQAEEQPKEEFEWVIAANLTGVYTMAKEVGKVMIAQKYGKIINVGSIHSNLAISPNVHHVSAYCASKGGVQTLTKALAAEWAQYGITVNAIGPAYFASEMTEAAIENDAFQQFVAFRCPMGRVGQEGELDGSLLYFASDASSYTTGQLLNIDGGWNTI